MLHRGKQFFKASVYFLMLAVLFFSARSTEAAETKSDIYHPGPADLSPATILRAIPAMPEPVNWMLDIEWIILNEQNQKIQQLQSDSLAPWQVQQWFVRANGHEWIVDEKMNALTPVHYERLDRIGENLVLFTENSKSGVMLPGGKKVLEARYDVIRQVDGLLLGGKGYQATKWKIFDLTGKEVNPFTWEKVMAPQANGYIPVKRNGFWGFIDSAGQQVVECVYDSLGTIVRDRLTVKFKGLYGILDVHDNWLVKPVKTPLTPLNDRLYIAENGNLTTIKSYEAGTVYFTSNPIEVKQGYFVESLENGTFWKINFSGRIINSAENLKQYEEIRLPSEGFIAVKIHGRYGFIDEQDRLRIAHRYDAVHDYHEGLAAYQLMNRWGFINKQERIVVQPLYDNVGDFLDGIAIVSRNGMYGAINQKGDEIVSLEYDAIERQENGRFIITMDGRKGLLSEKGRVIVYPKFEEIRDLNKGQVIIRVHDKYGVVSRLGDDLIPAIYDQITFDPFNGYYLAMKKK